MKDLVIISIYDSGFGGFSIMINGKVIEPKDEYDIGKPTLANKIKELYQNETDKFEEYLKKKFKNKTIIICNDGDIEVLKWKD